MGQITYADKSAINVNPDVADINKVNAADMNEIKTAVNDNNSRIGAVETGQTYSTNEVNTGKKWIDGKPIYMKVIETTNAQCQTEGTLVDKSISLSSLNIDFMCNVELILHVSNNFTGYNFIFGGNVPTTNTRCYYNNNGKSIVIRNANVGYNSATIYLVLEYTKTTD